MQARRNGPVRSTFIAGVCLAILSLVAAACTSMPAGVPPTGNVEVVAPTATAAEEATEEAVEEATPEAAEEATEEPSEEGAAEDEAAARLQVPEGFTLNT